MREVETFLRAEMHGIRDDMRHHFDVVAESLRDDIRMIADGLVALDSKVGYCFDQVAHREMRAKRVESLPRDARWLHAGGLAVLAAIVSASSSGAVQSTSPSQAASRSIRERTCVCAGASHVMAVLRDGTVRTWGGNGNGQLGATGTEQRANSLVPIPVNDVVNAVSVSAGLFHSLALLADGTVKAWGSNGNGQLGTGKVDGSHINPVVVQGIDHAVAVAAGGSHSLALLADGTVRAWGYGNNGVLGSGKYLPAGTSGAEEPRPVKVLSLTDAVAIAAGSSHSLALRKDGSVVSWGVNVKGQLGTGTREDSPRPVAVVGLSRVVAIAAGGDHSLALLDDGTVRAWGFNGWGQLGDGKSAVSDLNAMTPLPRPVQGITNAMAIGAGTSSSFAVLADGSLMAWGDNRGGALGIGDRRDGRNLPIKVPGVRNAVAVDGGVFFAVALLADGGVIAWGLDDQTKGKGMFGDGTARTLSRAPLPVTQLPRTFAEECTVRRSTNTSTELPRTIPSQRAAPAPSVARTGATDTKPRDNRFAIRDGVAGDRVIFFTDFSDDGVDDLPRQLKLKEGDMKIVQVSGRRLLRFANRTTLSIALPEVLSSKFTIDIDFVNRKVLDGWAFALQGNQLAAFDPLWSTVRWGTDGVELAGGGSDVPLRNNQKNRERYRGSPAALRVVGVDRSINVYLDEMPLVNVSNANFQRSNGLSFIVEGRGADNPAYLERIRVVANPKGSYDDLWVKGRVAIYGILFDGSSDRIRRASEPILEELGTMLRQHLELKLSIEGHTDTAEVADAESRLKLSLARASAVKSHLATEYQIESRRIEAKGLGDTKPVMGNTTPEGRASNRRLELVRQ